MDKTEHNKESVLVDEAGQLYVHEEKTDSLYRLSPRDYAGKLVDFKGTMTELGRYILCY